MVVIGGLCLALLVLAVLQTRRVAHQDDSAEAHTATAVVDVRGDAERLCQQARRAVQADGPVSFAFEPLGPGRTRVKVQVAGGEFNPRLARRRAALAEALADWLAENGQGSRVRHTG